MDDSQTPSRWLHFKLTFRYGTNGISSSRESLISEVEWMSRFHIFLKNSLVISFSSLRPKSIGPAGKTEKSFLSKNRAVTRIRH